MNSNNLSILLVFICIICVILFYISKWVFVIWYYFKSFKKADQDFKIMKMKQEEKCYDLIDDPNAPPQIMKCRYCESEYDNTLTNCPNCHAPNEEVRPKNVEKVRVLNKYGERYQKNIVNKLPVPILMFIGIVFAVIGLPIILIVLQKILTFIQGLIK